MAKIYASVEQLIGKTPLVALTRLCEHFGLNAQLFGKLEGYNPAGSAKDRVALAMVQDALASGQLQPGGTVIEPTSGNTGIGLACVAAVRKLRAIIVMPDSMSVERQKLIQAYGAQVVLTPGAAGMQGAVAKAEALQKTIPGSMIAGQFTNPINPKAHYETTGPEIWQDTDGKVDIFVAGVGTGGTVTGAGRYLKTRNPHIHICAVEPAASPLLSKGTYGSHGLQGIGANFVPAILDTQIYDTVLPVTEAQAYEAARLLGKTEGILAGISSGAALAGAIRMAEKPENKGKNIVVLLPDTGDHYLSTDLFG